MQITWTDTWTQEHRDVRTHSSAPALSIMPQPVLSAYCVPSTVPAVTLSLERQHRRRQAVGWVGLRQDGQGASTRKGMGPGVDGTFGTCGKSRSHSGLREGLPGGWVCRAQLASRGMDARFGSLGSKALPGHPQGALGWKRVEQSEWLVLLGASDQQWL